MTCVSSGVEWRMPHDTQVMPKLCIDPAVTGRNYLWRISLAPRMVLERQTMLG